jgi:Ca2+-binding RTX toxin-like protein
VTNPPPATLPKGPCAAILAATLALALAPAAHAGSVALEPRAGGVEELVYDAGPGERNQLLAAYDSGARAWTVTDPEGVSPGPGCVLPDIANTARAYCAVSSPGAGLATLRVGDGNDFAVLTGTGTRGVLVGGPGDDLLVGGAGDDVFPQGSRADGADKILGGLGEDRVDYSARRRGVRANLDGRGGDGQRGENDTIAADVEGIAGGRGADSLRGNSHENVLVGGRGSDRLSGGAGYDRIDAGPGDDGIQARDGTIDAVRCGSGRDRARLDGLDFFTGRCERVRRDRAGGATVLNVSWDNAGRLLVDVGCPADAPALPCVSRLDVAVEGRRLGHRRIGLGRGESASLSFPLPPDLAERLAAGGRARARTVVHSRAGRLHRKVTVIWWLPLWG